MERKALKTKIPIYQTTNLIYFMSVSDWLEITSEDFNTNFFANVVATVIM